MATFLPNAKLLSLHKIIAKNAPCDKPNKKIDETQSRGGFAAALSEMLAQGASK